MGSHLEAWRLFWRAEKAPDALWRTGQLPPQKCIYLHWWTILFLFDLFWDPCLIQNCASTNWDKVSLVVLGRWGMEWAKLGEGRKKHTAAARHSYVCENRDLWMSLKVHKSWTCPTLKRGWEMLRWAGWRGGKVKQSTAWSGMEFGCWARAWA